MIENKAYDFKEKIKNFKKNELNNDDKRNLLYGGRFLINKDLILGKGSFGIVYAAYDNILNVSVALKVEKSKSKKPTKILNEVNVYKDLTDCEDIQVFYGNGEKDGRQFVATTILGPNLENVFYYCKKDFSIRTICLIGIQCLNLIQNLHNKGYIHRDIKPENFSIGLDNTSKIYLIDFGLCIKYIDSNGNHIPFEENIPFVGTIRYCSINTHYGILQSRRDDLESFGYVILHFLLGNLPWQGVVLSNKEKKASTIFNKKLSVIIENLLYDYPVQFTYYFHYVKSLGYNETPNYEYLKDLFYEILTKEIHLDNNLDFDFEWNRKKNNENAYPKLVVNSYVNEKDNENKKNENYKGLLYNNSFKTFTDSSKDSGEDHHNKSIN